MLFLCFNLLALGEGVMKVFPWAKRDGDKENPPEGESVTALSLGVGGADRWSSGQTSQAPAFLKAVLRACATQN